MKNNKWCGLAFIFLALASLAVVPGASIIFGMFALAALAKKGGDGNE